MKFDPCVTATVAAATPAGARCAARSPVDPRDDGFPMPIMPTPVTSSRTDDGLLTMVDFKWLMAGLGWRVDLTRMRRDAAYLAECAQRGLASESALLRERGANLLRLQSTREAAVAVATSLTRAAA